MSENPHDYTRENYDSAPVLKVRYRGTCDCGRTVQATPLKQVSQKTAHAWIRCQVCGAIGRYEQHATEGR